MLNRLFITWLALVLACETWGQPILLNSASPDLERWMYPFNAAPCDRIASSTFGTLGDDSGVDTRHAQHLIGWDTDSVVATHRGATQYLIRRCRITLTINRGNLFNYDPSQDDFRTYFETNSADHQPDGDAGRPMELFGLAYRNGFDSATFTNCTAFGSTAAGQRNAYAVGWFTNGAFVDVSNNVGKTNDVFPPFEAWPFAIGETTNAAPGELVPAGAKVTFELNLADPSVVTYLQRSLHEGRLRFAVSSLHGTAGQLGQPSYPDFATHFNQAVVDPTRLELEGTVVRDLDSDGDGLPDDWEEFWFRNLGHTDVDDDQDGAGNREEFLAGTDPTRSDSVFRLLSIARSDANGVALRWHKLPNRRFEVWSSSDLVNWLGETNGAFEYPDAKTVIWKDSQVAPSKFYHLRAVPQN